MFRRNALLPSSQLKSKPNKQWATCSQLFACLLCLLFDAEGGCSMFVRNSGKLLPVYLIPRFRRQRFSQLLPWESEVSYENRTLRWPPIAQCSYILRLSVNCFWKLTRWRTQMCIYTHTAWGSREVTLVSYESSWTYRLPHCYYNCVFINCIVTSSLITASDY
jgi:hypothetical protein